MKKAHFRYATSPTRKTTSEKMEVWVLRMLYNPKELATPGPSQAEHLNEADLFNNLIFHEYLSAGKHFSKYLTHLSSVT